MKLNQKKIESELKKARSSDKDIKLFDGYGLELHIYPFAKSASWRYNYRYNSKQKNITLGKYPYLSLKEAREKLSEAKKLLEAGIDPAEEKQKKKKTKQESESRLFKHFANDWYNKKIHMWSAGHAKRTKAHLDNYILPKLGDIPIYRLTVPMVKQIIDELFNKKIYDTTQRVLSLINMILNYCVQIDVLSFNPCISLRGYVKTPKPKHMPALPENKFVDFFKSLLTHTSRIQTKYALILQIITFTRSGSLTTIEWKDIDFENKRWVIPEHKFKGARTALIVPLSEWAISILQRLKNRDVRSDGYVFSHSLNLEDHMRGDSLSSLLRKMGYKDIATPHGFRSTATDILNENGFNRDAIERQVGHLDQNAVRAAYHRTEYIKERIDIMNWYSEHIKKYYDLACEDLGFSLESL